MKLKKGLHGGTVSTIQLKLNITKDMNGAVYTCQAMNEALQRSVHDALALKVLCKYFMILKGDPVFKLNGVVYHNTLKLNELLISFTVAPIFSETNSDTTVGVENEALIITLSSNANPPSITYTWTKDGLPITQASYSGSGKLLFALTL